MVCYLASSPIPSAESPMLVCLIPQYFNTCPNLVVLGLGLQKIAMPKLACQVAIVIAQPNNCILQTSLRLLLRHCITFYANKWCLVVSTKGDYPQCSYDRVILREITAYKFKRTFTIRTITNKTFITRTVETSQIIGARSVHVAKSSNTTFIFIYTNE